MSSPNYSDFLAVNWRHDVIDYVLAFADKHVSEAKRTGMTKIAVPSAVVLDLRAVANAQSSLGFYINTDGSVAYQGVTFLTDGEVAYRGGGGPSPGGL